MSFQGSYSQTQICVSVGFDIIDLIQICGKNTTRELIPSCDLLLKRNNLKISDVDLLSVNYGPGAFTSLRVVVTTVNSISFATGIKIIPVCGLQAIFSQTKSFLTSQESSQKYDFIGCLLNAYGGQLFISIYDLDGNPIEGFESICLGTQDLVETLTCRIPQSKILMTGNGCPALIKAMEESNSNQNLIFDQQLSLLEPTVQTIAELAFQKYNSGQEAESKIIPNYIKAGFSKTTS